MSYKAKKRKPDQIKRRKLGKIIIIDEEESEKSSYVSNQINKSKINEINDSQETQEIYLDVYQKLLNIMDVKYNLKEVQFRDQEMDIIYNFIFKKQEIQKNYLIVTGQSGSGKTALLKDLFNKIQINNKDWTIKILMHNANKFKKLQDLYQVLFDELTKDQDFQMNKKDLQNNLQRLLSKLKEIKIIICIDEIETLLQNIKNKKDLFLFNNLNNIKFIGISNQHEIITNQLQSVNQSFYQLYQFEPYSSLQLERILMSRLILFKDWVKNQYQYLQIQFPIISCKCVSFLALKISKDKQSDARFLLNIMQDVIELQIQQFKTEPIIETEYKRYLQIDIQHFMKQFCKQNIHKNELLSFLTENQQILTFSIYQIMKQKVKKDEKIKIIQLDALYKQMQDSIKNLMMNEISLIDFMQLLNLYEGYNIIKVQDKGKQSKQSSKSKSKQSKQVEIKITYEELDEYFCNHGLFSSI